MMLYGGVSFPHRLQRTRGGFADLARFTSAHHNKPLGLADAFHLAFRPRVHPQFTLHSAGRWSKIDGYAKHAVLQTYACRFPGRLDCRGLLRASAYHYQFQPGAFGGRATGQHRRNQLHGRHRGDIRGKKASFLVDSPELIVALVPLSANTGLVAVTTPAGTATSSKAYDIVSTSWSAVTGFSIAANPNGQWTYGSEPALGGAFAPFTVSMTCFADVPCWWNGQNYPNSAAVSINTSLYTQHVETVILPNDLLYIAPEANVVAARWTAPSSAKYSIFGEFQGLDLSLPTVTVAIYENGTTALFTNSLTFFGDYVAFNLSNLALPAGTTIDFVVTSTDPGNDNVGLAATIDQIK